MGVFSTYNDIKYGNQRISENFLKKMGFKKSNQWGAPFRWGPGTVFWEKVLILEDENCLLPHSATVWYFPGTFTGYVTPFAGESANKVVAIINGNSSTADDYNGDALCKNDIQFVLDLMNQTLKKYNEL